MTPLSTEPPTRQLASRALKITADVGPFMLFVELLQCVSKIRKSPINFGDLPLKLARVEVDRGSTGAGKLRVTLYPSDDLLRHAATVFAGKLNSGIIKEIRHE
jgi:hypothetical protein